MARQASSSVGRLVETTRRASVTRTMVITPARRQRGLTNGPKMTKDDTISAMTLGWIAVVLMVMAFVASCRIWLIAGRCNDDSTRETRVPVRMLPVRM